MDQPATLYQRFQEQLHEFVFSPQGEGSGVEGPGLAKLRAELPPSPEDSSLDDPEAILKWLSLRESRICEGLRILLAQALEDLAQANLLSPHSYRVMFAYSRLMDALHRFAFEAGLEELPRLIKLQLLNGEKELEFNRSLLPRKTEKLEKLRAQLPQLLEQEERGAEGYTRQLEKMLVEELEACRARIEDLETSLGGLRKFRMEREVLLGRIVLFARGGYGRAELTFASDLDTGYCLETQGLEPGEAAVFQEWVLRTETLLRNAGVQTVHQFFELEEDLERFTLPETIHTVPSILESRAVAGNARVLAELQRKFLAILPYEDFLKKKLGEYEGQTNPTLTVMDLKEDRGGLRSIQIPLWVFGITHGATSFMSAHLIAQACKQEVMTLGEASRFLLALELLNELRNFVGAAQRFYYDREARSSNFRIPEFTSNRFNDEMARLYLFRKSRFASVDALDNYRLRLVADVRHISQKLLGRILDRTVTHHLGDLQVVVHLGSQTITALEPIAGGASSDPKDLLPDGQAVLRLFGFIARTNYDLSDALKDGLSQNVAGVTLTTGEEAATVRAAQFSELLGAPFAHRALATLFEINDPFSEGLKTLLGKFIPDYDQLVFLVREKTAPAIPVHELLIRGIARGQESLGFLKAKYPEFHAALTPGHVLAMKWSLFLYGITLLEGGGGNAARAGEWGAETLVRLGYRDAELEVLVRLLIEHHQTIVRLSRTATYFDQGVVEYFEIAGRATVNVILLFLVNLSIAQAKGGSGEADAARLLTYFDEISSILAEFRGVPDKASSLERINLYLDEKKEERLAEARFLLLLNKSYGQGMETALYRPLAEISPPEWERMAPKTGEISALQRQILLGLKGGKEQERNISQMVQTLRHHIRDETAIALTGAENEGITWFFSAFPNRYLLSTKPATLATQLAKFADFKTARIKVDVVPSQGGHPEGLLIYTRQLPNSHSRVAYSLSRKRLNILSGKVNRVNFHEGGHGYCYYF
ncbi:MAG: hypothetical protein IIA14_04885, partial [SAR324 cluster bacterium]|nr:hypothetical protein [SAR324 cluster bacterium]